MPDDIKPAPAPDAKAAPPTPPAAEKPKTVKLTIDGREVEVAPGTNLIEAARKVGVEIPYYCYHPKLPIAANCRVCLVEASNAPKLVPGCQTPVAEGIQVKTTTPRVKDEQRAVLEFLLLNHPVDCPICDQAGECKLQDYYMKYDFKPSRLAGGKVMKNKRKVLGPMVVLDQERCILCTRCVRFMREIAKQPQLGVFGRGSHEAIDIFPNQPLDSNYSGNVVDICPVGALLSRDNRFKVRSYFLSTTPSVCTGCSRNCSTFLDFFNDHSYRLRPRENAQVNDVWMCDHGRLSYRALEQDRALEPKIGRTNEGRTATREEAARVAAERVRPHLGKDSLAFVVSPVASVEDMLASLTFARDGLQLKKVFVSGRPADKADHLLLTADRNPNRKGLEWVAKGLGLSLEPFEALTAGIDGEKIKAVWMVGNEVPSDEKVFAAQLLNLETVVVQATNLGPVAGMAHVLLPASVYAEEHGTFVNFQGHIQRTVSAYAPRAESQPHWQWAAAMLGQLGAPVGFKSAREVFLQLSGSVSELKEFNWDAVPRYLKHARGIWAMPAAADGRPSGYRERSLP